MGNERTLIYDLSLDALKGKIKEMGQPEYRAEQIWTALYQTFRTFPEEITTLPKDFRDKLDQVFSFQALTPVRTIESEDGLTVKTLFRLHDGNFIEAVLMYYEDRRTLCISSQSGCAIGCSFCATGQMGFRRNLTSGEIIAQVLFYARYLAETNQNVTNVVVFECKSLESARIGQGSDIADLVVTRVQVQQSIQLRQGRGRVATAAVTGGEAGYSRSFLNSRSCFMTSLIRHSRDERIQNSKCATRIWEWIR